MKLRKEEKKLSLEYKMKRKIVRMCLYMLKLEK
jgi:hypothetical protein